MEVWQKWLVCLPNANLSFYTNMILIYFDSGNRSSYKNCITQFPLYTGSLYDTVLANKMYVAIVMKYLGENYLKEQGTL